MKDGIHPNYQPTTIRCACGAVYETRGINAFYNGIMTKD